MLPVCCLVSCASSMTLGASVPRLMHGIRIPWLTSPWFWTSGMQGSCLFYSKGETSSKMSNIISGPSNLLPDYLAYCTYLLFLDAYLLFTSPTSVSMKRVTADRIWSVFDSAESISLQNCNYKDFDVLYDRYERESKALFQVKASDLWESMINCHIETSSPAFHYSDIIYGELILSYMSTYLSIFEFRNVEYS